eukprot:1143845-Pelagomonas_calceolata.AAC.3
MKIPTIRVSFPSLAAVIALSAVGSLAATGSHDRSLRRWQRSSEPFFVEEEKEARLESMFEADLEADKGGPQGSGAEAALAGPLGRVAAGEGEEGGAAPAGSLAAGEDKEGGAASACAVCGCEYGCGLQRRATRVVLHLQVLGLLVECVGASVDVDVDVSCKAASLLSLLLLAYTHAQSLFQTAPHEQLPRAAGPC